jgi:gliding motility-associated lipoprotein GldH
MKKLLLYILVLLMAFASCSGGKIFEKHEKIKGNVWDRFDVIEFEVNIEDVSDPYDFFVSFRYMEQFPLKYVDIDFTIYAPSGETRSSEHRIKFKDKEGKLIGKGMGDLWDLEEVLRESYTFSEPGICKVEISSTMSYADIPGIMTVGLIVRESR